MNDLANVVNEAALLAARRVAEAVEMRDFEEAIDRVMLGLEKKSRVMSAAEKERVAHHKAGHALVRCRSSTKTRHIAFLSSPVPLERWGRPCNCPPKRSS